jgi:hypothetical protein
MRQRNPNPQERVFPKFIFPGVKTTYEQPDFLNEIQDSQDESENEKLMYEKCE